MRVQHFLRPFGNTLLAACLACALGVPATAALAKTKVHLVVNSKAGKSGAFGTLTTSSTPTANLATEELLREVLPHEAVVLANLPQLSSRNIASDFGMRFNAYTGNYRSHDGVDILAPRGSPILAAGSGRVAYAGWSSGYGNLVVIDHGQGISTRYGHASILFVHPGDLVQESQPIGAVGTTGNASTPHLHFELSLRNSPIDPKLLLSVDGNRRAGLAVTPMVTPLTPPVVAPVVATYRPEAYRPYPAKKLSAIKPAAFFVRKSKAAVREEQRLLAIQKLDAQSPGKLARFTSHKKPETPVVIKSGKFVANLQSDQPVTIH